MRTSDLSVFEDAADAAREVIDAVQHKLRGRLGAPCELTVCHALSDGEIAELFRLQREAFGADGEAFDRKGLDEVLDDPESLFVLLWVGERLIGASFAYWDWEDRPTVPGTDFFLDTGMVEDGYRGKGIGAFVLAGMLLLAELLECERVGIAAWQGGANRDRLVGFYQRMGFEPVPDRMSPHVLMWTDLSAAKVQGWRKLLELPAEGP